MSKIMQKLKKDKRVKHVDLDDEGLIVTLNKYTNDRAGECHVFGADSASEAMQYIRESCVPCDCKYCLTGEE